MSAAEAPSLRHILSIESIGRAGILDILGRSEEFRLRQEDQSTLLGKVLGLLVLQPSTRTRVGFHAAMARLGGAAIDVARTKFQNGMTASESLIDTIRSISTYFDCLVLRHGSAEDFRSAVGVSKVPVINAGCGNESHPTQALIDIFSIQRHFGRLEGLRIGIVGDIGYSRCSRSLIQALAYFPPRELRLMAPSGREHLDESPGEWGCTEISRLNELVVEGLDVLYVAGLPEGLGEARLDEPVRERFRLTKSRAEKLPVGALVLSPLPRIDEIDDDVDELAVAGYFSQSQEGLFVRCAILEHAMGVSGSDRFRGK